MSNSPQRPSTGRAQSPRVWMDLTTTIRSRGGQSTGTLRVERSYAVALSGILGDRLRFCRYDPMRQRFSALPGLPEAAFGGGNRPAARAPGMAFERAERLAGRLKRLVRRTLRYAAGEFFRRSHASRLPFPEAAAGDVLLLAGETWGEAYDLEVLRMVHQRQKLRLAAVCQDLIPIRRPQYFAANEFLERFRRYADFLVRDVDLIIAISQSTRSDILDYARAQPGSAVRVEVVTPGADIRVSEHPRPPRELPGIAAGSFALSVSTIQLRKNIELLYHLWRRFAEEGRQDIPTLLIVGRQGFGTDDLIFQLTHDPAVRASIKLLHGVADSELAWLYQNCRFTLYPSLYEGWGLPVSESLAYGKFCIASNTSSLPEAGEGLTQHLDPLDFAAWHAAIVLLASSPTMLAEAEARIRAHYKPRTWAGSSQDLGRSIGRLLDEDGTARGRTTVIPT